MQLNGIIIFIIAGLIKYLKKREKTPKWYARKCKPFGLCYYLIFSI